MLDVPGLMRILLMAMTSMSRLAICLSLLAAASADLTLVDFSDGSPGMACAFKKKQPQPLVPPSGSRPAFPASPMGAPSTRNTREPGRRPGSP